MGKKERLPFSRGASLNPIGMVLSYTPPLSLRYKQYEDRELRHSGFITKLSSHNVRVVSIIYSCRIIDVHVLLHLPLKLAALQLIGMGMQALGQFLAYDWRYGGAKQLRKPVESYLKRVQVDAQESHIEIAILAEKGIARQARRIRFVFIFPHA